MIRPFRLFLGALFTTLLIASSAKAAVVCWGRNSTGACGAGFKTDTQDFPITSALPEGEVAQVKVAEGFSLALMRDGTVRAAGNNLYGELGDGTKVNRAVWVTVKGIGGVGRLEGVVALAPAGLHVTALLATGQVVTWGGDLFGQLDDGFSAKGSERAEHARDVPYLTSLAGMVGVAGGGATSYAWNAAGQLYGWGENRGGQLGIGVKSNESLTPVQAHIAGVQSVSCGGQGTHGATCHAVLKDGTVDGWGVNIHGQVGDGTQTTRLTPVPIGLTDVSEVSDAASGAMALTNAGVVYAWGENGLGQLGTTVSSVCVNKARGTTVACSTRPIAVLHGASQISRGGDFGLALITGRVFAWGTDQFGELANGTVSRTGTATPRPILNVGTATSISAGRRHALALITGPPPPPLIEALPGPGSITVRWRTTGINEWQIRTRPNTHPESKWGAIIRLPSTASSFTLTNYCLGPACVPLVAGQQYAVVVQQAKTTGSALYVAAAPL